MEIPSPTHSVVAAAMEIPSPTHSEGDPSSMPSTRLREKVASLSSQCATLRQAAVYA